ncbi:hypothetical protein LguiB_001554 [Lonicera macranthoides]
MTNNNTTAFSLRSVLEKEKLNTTNFLDWFRNLRIVLKQERKDYVLENAIPEEPAANAPRAQKDAYQKHLNDDLDVSCLMLASMNADLQKQFENMNAFDMVKELKSLFQEQARVERFETTKSLFSCKLPEGGSVTPHVLKMIGYIDHLERLGTTISQELATDVIL